MKALVLIISVVLFSTATFGQSARDEKEIRSLIQKMEDMWNAQDYSYFGNDDFFSSDAVLINPVGMYWKDRSEIVKGTQAFGESIFKYETAKYTIKSLRFLSTSVALVVFHSLDKMNQDFTYPDGHALKKGDASEAMFMATLVLKDKGWRITSWQVTHVNPLAVSHDPVKSN